MKKYLNHSCLLVIMCIVFLFNPHQSIAQSDSAVNNGYYIKYPKKLMLRTYLAQKFAPLTISSASRELNYKTNSKLNLGIGATYKAVTLNLSYGFNFLNKDRGGKTKGLDAQFHIYPEQWAIDLIGSFRKGFYLDPDNNNSSGLNLTNYFQRPDIKRNIIGVSVYRVPNSGKFSFRAGITQNDWQIRSAGSILFGGDAFLGMLKGDSALVPRKVNASFEQAGINKINFINIGPGVGYAYTLVIDKNFFITASGTASLHINFSTEHVANNKNSQTTVTPGIIYKGAIGYNSASWSVSAHILGNALYVGSKASDKEYFLPTGIMRFVIAKKFVE